MLKVEKIQDYFWISGPGVDWYLLPPDSSFIAYGVQGECFWIRRGSGEITVYHAPSQRLLGSVQIPLKTQSYYGTHHLPSRNGRDLWVLDVTGEEPRQLNVVHLSELSITSTIQGFQGHVTRTPVESPDGFLVFTSMERGEHFSSTVVHRVDPARGIHQNESIAEAPFAAEFKNHGFQSLSPDGRFLIRVDHTQLPKKFSKVGGFLGWGAKDGPAYYGLNLQIWQAFPLQFLRRSTVAWLKTEELPDDAHLSVAKNAADTQLTRSQVWDALAEATDRATLNPYDTGPPREFFPEPARGHDAAWQAVLKNYAVLVKDWIRFVGWQPDGEAFWININGFLSCVGIDGSVSPRLYLERRGLRKGTWLPCAASPSAVQALPGRRAEVRYPEGQAVFDGKSAPETLSPVAIPERNDHWIDKTNLPDLKARDEAFAKVAALRGERQKLFIPLAEWNEEGVITALISLKEEMKPSLFRRAADSMIDLRFKLDDRLLSEPEFFISLRERFPSSAPALREMIAAYVAVTDWHNFLFSVGEDGAGLFANAVKSLAVLEADSIPTLMAYGRLVDPEHEYFFAGDTVPAYIQTHGWNDATLDFVFWVLIRNYYNTLQDYGPVWKDWGMREAAVLRDPVTLARRLTNLYAAELEEKNYGTGGLEQLARHVPQPHEPWEAAFFAELGQILKADFSGGPLK